jgi:predicted nucleic acid-binding protein
MIIYCDSCILIYFFDHIGLWNQKATSRLSQLARAGDLIATSDLVRLECRIKPMNLGDTAKLVVFDAFFAQPDVRRVAISTDVFDRATEIRARYRFKLGDSLHLAAAVEASCDSLLTNDNRLAASTELPVEVLA